MDNKVDIILSNELACLEDKLIHYGKETASQMEIYKIKGVTVQHQKCIAASRSSFSKSLAKQLLQHHKPAPQQKK